MPPPSGDQPGPDLVEITPETIDPGVVLDHVTDPGCGAVVLFLGTVRDHSPGIAEVTGLDYEVYEGVVEERIGEVVGEARGRWPVRRVAVLHRVGELSVGEITVAVAVSSPHRGEAFAAAGYLIDEVKTRAPIWKKEHWPGGAAWVREDRRHRSAEPPS